MNKISRNDLLNNHHHMFEFREVNQNDDDNNDNDYNHHHNRILNFKQNDSTNSLIVLNINDDERNEF